jgi:hypothetical protein
MLAQSLFAARSKNGHLLRPVFQSLDSDSGTGPWAVVGVREWSEPVVGTASCPASTQSAGRRLCVDDAQPLRQPGLVHGRLPDTL